jgi:hypothetical protein
VLADPEPEAFLPFSDPFLLLLSEEVEVVEEVDEVVVFVEEPELELELELEPEALEPARALELSRIWRNEFSNERNRMPLITSSKIS